MTDFLRPQQLTEAEQATEHFASDESLKNVGPMPDAPLAALSEPGQGTNGGPIEEKMIPAPMPVEGQGSGLGAPSKLTRPFERVPVPKASVRKGEEKETELKKQKKPSAIFTRFYIPFFLLLISIVIIGGYMLLDPIIRSLKNTNEFIVAHQQESNDVGVYLDSIKRSIAAANAIPPDVLKKVDQAIPRDVDQPRLLATMEAFGAKTGISLDSVQFSADSASQNVTTPSAIPTQGPSTLHVSPININLNVISPSYAEARVFLESIEQSIPILDVSRIGVSGDPTTGEFAYQLQMKTYSITKVTKPPVTTTPTAPPSMPPVPAPAE